jgi:O-antigen ligase
VTHAVEPRDGPDRAADAGPAARADRRPGFGLRSRRDRGPRPQRGSRVDRSDLPAYLICFLGMIVFNMFSGYSKLLGFPIGPDRLFFFAGVVLLLLDPVARRERRLRLRPVHVYCMALVGLTTWSGAANGTLTPTTGLYLLLDTMVVPFVMFALAPFVFSTPGRRDLLVRVLVCMGIYLGLTGIFETVGPHALVWPSYIMDPSVGIQFGRARGPFAESEAEGLSLAICMYASMYGFVRLPGRWRIAAAVSTGACAVSVVLCLTRSVWVGSVIGVTIVSLLVPRLRRILPLFAGGVVAVLGLALATIPTLRQAISSRTGDQRSLWDRQNTNAAGIRIVEQKPLSGVGWANFVHVVRDWIVQGDTYPITNVDISIHNVILSRAAELGVFGAALTVATMLSGLFYAVLRRQEGDVETWRMILIAALCCYFTSAMLSPLSYPLVNLMMWLMAGMVLAPYQTRPRTTAAPEQEHALAAA